MPAVHSCDQTAHGLTYHLSYMAKLGVSIEIRWAWDGVSVYPACDGALVNGGTGQDNWAVRVVNNDTVPYYAHSVVRGSGQPKTWTLNPGQTATISASQAAANGYTRYSDFYDLTLTTVP